MTMDIVSVNIQLNYANEIRHSLFVDELHELFGHAFVGDGHPFDGTTDLDFQSDNQANVGRNLRLLKRHHPHVFIRINEYSFISND
jgi:hypothetical protein